jgi:hypothetical protein
MTQKRHGCIGERRGRLYVTVVSPTKDQHVGNEKSKKRTDAQPYISIGENANNDGPEIVERPGRRRSNALHSFAQQNTAQRCKNHNDEQGEICFQVKSGARSHALIAVPDRVTALSASVRSSLRGLKLNVTLWNKLLQAKTLEERFLR